MAEQRRPEREGAGGFDGGVEPWLRGLGQIRDVVRQHLVADQVAEVVAATGRTALRAIDVGCGQGTQALGLARAGHEVICLDPSPALLEVLVATLGGEPDEVRARVRVVTGTGEDAPALVGGGFDLVLCHGVLMYLDDDAGLLDALARMTGPDGRLSLVVRNGDALGLRPGLLGDWAAVPAAVDADGYENRLGLRARAHGSRTSTARSAHEACGVSTGGVCASCATTSTGPHPTATGSTRSSPPSGPSRGASPTARSPH